MNRFRIHTDNKTTVNHIDGWNSDIIQVIHGNVPKAKSQMRDVSKFFKKSTELETCKSIWDFLKKEITYKKDPDGFQNIKLPGRFVGEASGDCKSYSLFTASILENLNIPYSFRYTSYSSNPTPQHVYIITDNGIIIDAVWNKFNSEKKFTHKKDYKMKIQTLSGIGCNTCYSNPQPLGSVVMIGNTMPVGNIFKKGAAAVKKAGSKVQDAVKKTRVVKTAAKLQTKAKNTGVVKTLSKLQSQVKDQGARVLTLAAPRRAYRTLVAINFRGWATVLNKKRNEAAKVFEKMGGKPSELFQSIDAGLKRKAIFPSDASKVSGINGIGEPVTLATVGATLAIAAPIVAAFASIVKSVKDTANTVVNKETTTTPGTNENFGPYTGNQNYTGEQSTDNSTGQNNTVKDGAVSPGSENNFTKPLLIGLGLFIAGKAFKVF